jgi:hypothetical protein
MLYFKAIILLVLVLVRKVRTEFLSLGSITRLWRSPDGPAAYNWAQPLL